MTGPHDSVIGRRKEAVIERFLTGIPTRFEVATDDVQLQGVVVEVDIDTAKAIGIKRIQLKIIE
jgi:calcineurin-like phosphoesterase